jgi:hypothetical protein
MTTTVDSSMSDTPTPDAESVRVARHRPVRSRRRPAMIALGIALIVLGGLATVWLVTNMTRTVSVLVVSADVGRGDTVAAEDLRAIQVAGGQDLDAVTSDAADTVVGGTALVDLPAGTLVTSANVGDALAVPSGSSIVGVSLTRAQLPAYPLAAGDRVRLVDTPVAQGDPPAETPRTFAASVFTVREDAEAGTWVIDLVVPSDEAADIAARAASGRVALVLDTVTGE